MNAPDRLPPDATELTETEARLRAGMRRAPLPEGVALRLAAAKRAGQSRRGVWLSRILSAATVALCAGLLWHFTSNPARVTPGGENEKAPPKQKDDGKNKDADQDRIAKRYDLKALVEKALINRNVMRSLFPENEQPALGLPQPEPAQPTDEAVLTRVAAIVKDTLRQSAVFTVSTDKKELALEASAETHAEIEHLLKMLHGDFDNEKTVVTVEFHTYDLNEKQFAKLMPDAKAEASAGARTLTAQALDALVQRMRELKIEAQLAPRMTVYPGQGANMSVTAQKSYIAGYDIREDTYDPEIKSYFTGYRYCARAIPAPDGSVSVQVRMKHVAETGVTTQYITEKVPGAKDGEKSLRLPIQVPQLQTTTLPSTVLKIPADGGAAIYMRQEGKEKKDAKILLAVVSAKAADLEETPLSDESTGTVKIIDLPVQR